MEEEKRQAPKTEHKIVDFVKGKGKVPRKIGHGFSDKRPHFKTFKSPGVK